jgi:hypothetical protein
MTLCASPRSEEKTRTFEEKLYLVEEVITIVKIVEVSQ